MVFLNNWSTISETEHGFYGLVLSNICLSSLATVMNSWYPIYAFCACHHWHVSEIQWQLFKRCHLVCPNISHSWPSAHSHPATQPSCKAPLGCLDESVIIIAFISINFFHASRLCIPQHITAYAVRTDLSLRCHRLELGIQQWKRRRKKPEIYLVHHINSRFICQFSRAAPTNKTFIKAGWRPVKRPKNRPNKIWTPVLKCSVSSLEKWGCIQIRSLPLNFWIENL